MDGDQAYMDFMTQANPDDLDRERQRAVASQLRGLAGTGAMGSTSQIEEISKAGNNAMDQAFESGEGMGLKKSRQDIADTREASRGSGWRGTAGEREDIMGSANELDFLKSFADTFEDDYASTFVGGALVKPATRYGMNSAPQLTKALAASPAGNLLNMRREGETDEQQGARMENESQFWRNYQRISTIPERSEIFGATMTAPELVEWNKAEITERMTPTQVRMALRERIRIAEDVMARIQESYKALGMTQGFLNANKGDGPRTAQTVQAAQAQRGGAPRSVGEQAWLELSEDDREYFLENMGEI